MPVMAWDGGPGPDQRSSSYRRGADSRPHNLPVRLTRPVGRAGIVGELASRLERRRLVSIVGPGGMGKTTVAVAVAEQRLEAYEHGARFVDLSPLSDPALVPAALGSALGIDVPPENPWPGLEAALRDSHMLIVLDNCEHLIDAAAQLAEFVLRAAGGIHLLATSREPLGAEGEWTHRLRALEWPDPTEELDCEQALSFPAIELFVERASAKSDAFRLTTEDLPALRQLCHLLDGMPLAIELAAGRVDGMGLRALASRLDDVFRLLNHGRRTAVPRHQTLEALLDWSHALLTADERVVLRRLSTFRAAFTMSCAIKVAAGDDVSPETVEDCVTSLVAKSLLAIEPDADMIRFRLLHSTRDYASAKLVQAGERERFARRHASHFAELLRLAHDQMDSMPTAAWMVSQRRIVDDVRAATEWAFSDTGDLEIGITLVAMLDFYLPSVPERYVPQLELALKRVRTMTPRQPLLELQLYSGMCFANGMTGVEFDPDALVATALSRTIEQADEVESRRHVVKALYSLCSNAMGRGDYPTLDTTALRVKSLAGDPTEPLAVLLADRYRAMSLHYLGDQRAARRLAESVRDYRAAHAHRHYVGQVPKSVSMRGILSRIHWICGESDQAVQVAQEALDLSVDEHPLVLSLALATAAIPVALWRGEWERANAMIERLGLHAVRHSQGRWQSWANSYRFLLRLRTNERDRQTLLETWVRPHNPMELDIIGTFDEDLVSPLTLQRVENGTVGWCAAEVLRAQAWRQWRRASQTSAAMVEALLQRSLHIAREQEALAWELRTATSLACVWQAQGQQAHARALLGPVLDRCSEGRSTRDVLAARALLESLR